MRAITLACTALAVAASVAHAQDAVKTGPAASWPRHANLPLTCHPVPDTA